jgi:hypothetical protein
LAIRTLEFGQIAAWKMDVTFTSFALHGSLVSIGFTSFRFFAPGRAVTDRRMSFETDRAKILLFEFLVAILT